MENGAANLNSMVSEHDDNKNNEELTIGKEKETCIHALKKYD